MNYFSMFSVFWITELLEQYIAALLFCSNYPRKPHFTLRAILGFILTVAVMPLIPNSTSIWKVIRYTISFFTMVLMMKFCYSASWSQALFSTSAGRATKFFVANFIYLLNANGNIFHIQNSDASAVLELFAFYIPIYVLAYFIFVRRIQTEEYDSPDNWSLKLISFLILFLCVIVNRFVKDFGPREPNVIIAESLYGMICSGLCLFLQFEICRRIHIQKQEEMVRVLWWEEQKQLCESRKTMELINIKCHDIRHRIAESEIRLSETEKKELNDLIRIYDSYLDTGNPTLNIIMADRGLLCEQKKIQLSFMGDATCLNTLSEADVFSLFGNALNNAINAVLAVAEEKRQVSVIIQQRGNLVSASVINYYSGDLAFSNGLPVTTAEDDPGYHGYGMRSMQMVAQRHGGDIKVTAENGMFTLHVWFTLE